MPPPRYTVHATEDEYGDVWDVWDIYKPTMTRASWDSDEMTPLEGYYQTVCSCTDPDMAARIARLLNEHQED